MVIKHAFTNPIADDPAFTGTKPSDWNADHIIEGGVSGTFTSQDGKTITVTNGIITAIT